MWPALVLEVQLSAVDYYAEEFGQHQVEDQPSRIPFLAIAWTVWLLVAGGSLLAFPYLIQLGQRRQELKRWIQLVRDGRDSKVHKVLALLNNETEEEDCWRTATETRHQILSTTTCSAADNIVVLARRCRRHGRHESINAITEELYDQAHQRALQWDTTTTSNPQTVPLYGVPVCVKEWISLQGTYATAGMACRLTKPSEQDCLVVQLLKQAGAIPLCKGNNVQLLMLAETNNHIWGRTSNPWDLNRTPGGSSGGDAALVAMGCVPLSISSDRGGSIRLPASYCGIVGFRPTPCRSSLKGCMTPRNHKNGLSIALSSVIGPMARCVDDCALFMKAICVSTLFEQDPNAPPVPWNDALYNNNLRRRKLKIGYFYTDHWFRPCPTSERAMQETISNLEQAGHDCVEMALPTNGWTHFELWIQLNGSESLYRVVQEALDGEAAIPEYQTMVWGDYVLSKLPQRILPLLGWFVKWVMGARMAHFFQATRALSTVYKVWQATAELIELRGKWSDAVRDSGVDVILHPAMPIPAPFHGKATDISPGSYCVLAPLLGWPSGVVPVTTIRQEEQYYHDKTALPMDQQDAFAEAASRVMKNSAGLPMNVSVLAPAFRDETCLLAMKEIERLADFKARPQAYIEAMPS